MEREKGGRRPPCDLLPLYAYEKQPHMTPELSWWIFLMTCMKSSLKEASFSSSPKNSAFSWISSASASWKVSTVISSPPRSSDTTKSFTRFRMDSIVASSLPWISSDIENGLSSFSISPRFCTWRPLDTAPTFCPTNVMHTHFVRRNVPLPKPRRRRPNRTFDSSRWLCISSMDLEPALKSFSGSSGSQRHQLKRPRFLRISVMTASSPMPISFAVLRARAGEAGPSALMRASISARSAFVEKLPLLSVTKTPFSSLHAASSVQSSFSLMLYVACVAPKSFATSGTFCRCFMRLMALHRSPSHCTKIILFRASVPEPIGIFTRPNCTFVSSSTSCSSSIMPLPTPSTCISPGAARIDSDFFSAPPACESLRSTFFSASSASFAFFSAAAFAAAASSSSSSSFAFAAAFAFLASS
eukprot:Rhum_TRINITY_DN6402_c0_g11::Rhum_TRINITY_DN6402_c0_g11_i1::g.19972::m.19972